MTPPDDSVFRTAPEMLRVPWWRAVVVAGALFVVMLLTIFLIWTDGIDRLLLLIVAGTAVAMGGMIYVLQNFVMGRHRDAMVQVGAAGLVLEGGGARRPIRWDEITRVVITHDAAGRPVLIEADVRGGPKATMRWLERMDEVVTRIEAHLAAGTPVERRRNFWRFDNTLAWMVAASIAAALLIYFYAINNLVPAPYRSGVATTVTTLWVSGFLLFGRPQSRSNPGMRRFELGMVALLLSLQLASYLAHFLGH